MTTMLAQGMGPAPAFVGFLFAAAILGVAGPAIGLFAAFIHDRRPRRWRFPILAVYYVTLATAFVLGQFGDDPSRTGFLAGLGFCGLLPIGFALGCWFAFAGPQDGG
jgi:hypothetical protein